MPCRPSSPSPTCGALRPAARKLGLSPSGVTRLIAALEERLGARLLQRTTRQVTLTDAGSRYLERARRILADIAEAEDAIEGERTRPEGRLVISAPVGFGRLHVSGDRDRLPEALSRRRRRPSAIRPHDQPRRGRRRSRGPDRPSARLRRWWRAMSARCGGSWWPRPAISRRAASRRQPQDIAAHDTIQFGAMTAALDWRFVEDGREIRVASTPRFATNSSDAAIQYAEADGGLTRVLAYQAAEFVEGRAAENRAGAIRAAGDADPHRLSDVAAVVGQGANVHRSRGRDAPTGISAQDDEPDVRVRSANDITPSSAPRETSRWPARSRRHRP